MWLTLLINWVVNSNLKQFSGIIEYLRGVIFLPTAIFNAFSLPGFPEWLTLECLNFFSFLKETSTNTLKWSWLNLPFFFLNL